MKKIWIALLCLTSPALADDTSMYESLEAFMDDLEQMAVRCGSMAIGQVDEEIFSIQFVRGADGRCKLGSGEIDPMVAAFFAETELSRAGLVDGNSIWVAAK